MTLNQLSSFENNNNEENNHTDECPSQTYNETDSSTISDTSDLNLFLQSPLVDLENSHCDKQNDQKERDPILVTGGAGFIGCHVANFLLQRGEEVVIVDEMNDYYDVRLKRSNLEMLQNNYDCDQLRIFEGDICDIHFIEGVFNQEKPRRIIHLAARAGVRPSIEDPLIYVHSNIKATTILLDLAQRYSCKSFVFASSSSVYGGSDKIKFSELDVVDFPVSPYAATKKSCELLAYTYYHLYGLNCAGLRFFTVYGPRGRPDMAPFKFIDRISRGLAIQKFGDGTTSRDYTYIDDIVDGVIKALDRPLGFQIYNIGNENPIELNYFIKIVEQVVGKTARIEQLPNQPGDVPRTCADISKAQLLLDYQPKVQFEEGIRRTVEWYNKYYSRSESN